MANQIRFGMKFDVDKSGLNGLKSELQAIQKMTEQDLLKINPGTNLQDAKNQLTQIKQSAGEIQQALNRAFNRDLGTVNITKFNNELKKLDINKIYKDLNLVGTTGKVAFRNTATEVLTTNMHLKQTHKLLDDMATSMANTVKWGITSSIFNNITESIQKAWTYTKSLDTSLNDIRIVTDKSAESMADFAIQANKAAKELGASTRDYTDASLIYYQQGLSDEETKARTETTLKAANVTGQKSEEVSEQLTAIWNGYKVSAEEAELYIDKVAAVAAATAADLEELSTGMGKVASAANTMGVNVDQMNALLATAVSVTREAPETIGTSFRSIFSRMGQLKSDGTDEFGVTLGKVTTQLQSMGIEILDQQGNMRDMGVVITEVGEKWQGWTQAQKIAAAQAMAGTQQYSRLMAVFENWDMYEDALETSTNAMGTLNKQQDIYLESTAAHLQQLNTSWERVYNAFTDTEGINDLIDGVTSLTDVLANFIEMLGGSKETLLFIGSIGSQVFSKQLAVGISTTIDNLRGAKENAKTLSAEFEILNQFKGLSISDDVTDELINMKEQILDLNDITTEEQQNMANAFISRRNDLENEKIKWEELKNSVQEFYKSQTDEDVDITGVEKDDIVYSKVENTIKSVENRFKDVPKSIDEYTKALNRAEKANNDFSQTETQKALDDYTESLDEAQEVIDGFVAVTEQMIDENTLVGESADELIEAYNRYQKALAKTTDGEDALIDDQEVQDAANNFINVYGKFAQEVSQKAKGAMGVLKQESSGATQKIQDDILAAQAEYDNFIKKLKQPQKIQNFINIASGISQMVSAIQTLGNIGEIFKNEDLSNGEKLLQILMALGTAVPLLVTGYMNLAKSGKIVLTTLIANTQAHVMEAMVIKLKNKYIAQGIPVELAEAKAKQVATRYSQMHTAAIWKEVAAMLAKKALMVGGILLAIAAVAAATYGLIKAYNADADAAKAASEAAADAAKNYEKVAEKAKELKETISDYSDGVNQLKELTRGTEEYKNALTEANEKAKELIETYGLYNDYYMQDGAIVFKEGVLEGLQAQVDLEKQRAESIKYSTRVLADQAQLQADTTALRRNIADSHIINKQQAFHSLGLSTALDTQVLSVSDEEIENIVDSLNKLSEEEYDRVTRTNEAFQEWVDTIDKGDLSMTLLSEQIGENREAFITLAKSTKEAADSQQYYINQTNRNTIEQFYGNKISKLSRDSQTGEVDTARYNQILDIVNKTGIQERIKKAEQSEEDYWSNYNWNLAGDKIVTPEAWSHEFSQSIGGIFTSASTNLNTEVTNSLKGIGVSNDKLKEVLGTTNLDTDKDLATAYAKMAGINIEGAIWKDNKWQDESGDTLVDVSSVEARSTKRAQIFNELRQQSTRESLQKSGEYQTDQAIDSIENIMFDAKSFGAKYGTDFTNAVLNAMATEGNKFDLSSIYADLDAKEVQNILAMSDEDIAASLGISQEDFSQFGIKSAADFGKAFKEGLSGWEWDRDAAISSIISKQTEELEELGLDSKELEEYTEHLMNMANESENLADSLETDTEASVKVAKAIMRLNKGVETLGENFEDWQDVLKNSDKSSQEYSEALSGMQAAMADLLNTSEDYISDDFIQQHLEQIAKAAEGSEEAIDSLKFALAEDIILKVAIDNGLSETGQSELQGLIADIQNTIPDIEVGTVLELSEFEGSEAELFEKMKEIIRQAGLTAEQANEAFSAMGFTTTFATQQIPTEQVVPRTVTVTDVIEQKKDFWGNITHQKVATSSYQDGVDTYMGSMTQVAMETSEDGSQVPKLESLTYTGGGSNNNYSSKNKGGKTSPKKSSGAKTKEPDKKDPLKEQIDRYHDINIELDQIDDSLSKLEKENKKLFGADLINNLNEQYKLLNQEIDATARKTEEARKEMQELQTELSGKGVAFNNDGTISNYKDALKGQEAYVNSLIEKYNKMTAKEQEAFKETVEKAEEDFETFKDNLERYDEIITGDLPELAEKTQEAIDRQIEISVEKFNMEIETRLDMSQAERDWNEFKKKVIDNIDDDDILGNAKANLEDFSSYYKDNFEGVIQVNTDHVNDILFELDEMDRGLASKYYGDNRTKALEDLKTYYTQLMEDLTAVEDLSDKIRQSYLDIMDEAKEKFDEQISAYEQIADLIDHDIKLIELLGGEKSYAAFGEYYNKLEINNNKQLDFQRQQVEFWKAQMEAAKENPERWEKAKENWTAAVTDWRDLVNSSIENLQDKYLNTISEIFERLNNEVTNGLGLEYVNEEWSLINRNAEEYLDTINAMYGIQELSNKYLDAIDQTDSISAQQELNELMEQEIAALEEKDKLTQYDIDRANMRYNIALKQIALEEAQQNKTSMRLRRDSQGNYSYQFVADEDAVGAAEDELAAAQNELYNFDKENYINNLDELYAAYEEYQQKMFEAAQINDPDERAQRELLINEQYGELINGLVEQNQTIRSNLHESAFDELARLYKTDVENYRRMSEEERNILLNEMIPQWTSGVQQMADTFAGEGGLGEVCKESLAEISQATEDYKDDLEEVEDAAGLTFEEIVSGTDDAIIETEDLLNVNDELIEQYEDELDAIDAVIDELDKLIERFEKAKQAAIDASKEAYEYFQSADDDMADEAFKDRDYSRDMMRAIIAGYSTEDKHYKDLETRRTKKLGNTKPEVDNNRLKNLFEAYRAGNSEAIFVVTEVANGNKHFTNQFLDDHGFKTGGYTGNWTGEDGRLAFLHQKELVLNAEDTQNVLGAVKILRNITDLIGNSVIRKAAAMSGNITTPQGGNITNETLEQDVHIDAHFPNVTSSREIENALDNLMNKASQRALRKR